MTKPLAHDEQMYCTGGVLLANGETIYRDFSYVSQMPYHALLYAAVYKISGTTSYLLTGRLISVICNILTAVCIVGIYRRVFKEFAISGMIFGLGAVVLYLFNPVVDYANGHAWNHDVVNLLVVGAVWLFIATDFKSNSKYRRICVIGALLTLASCMRITTVLAEAVFFLTVVFVGGEFLKDKFKTLLCFCAGAAVVLIWPIWLIVQAGRAFYLNMFFMPMLNSRFLHEAGMVHDKFDLTVRLLSTPGYAILLTAAAYVYISLIMKRRKLKFSEPANFILTGGLALMYFVIAYLPPTMWVQYLAAPALFLVLGLAQGIYYLRRIAGGGDEGQNIKPVFLTAGTFIAAAVLFYPVFLFRIPAVLNPADWTPIRLHKTAVDIAQRTPEPKRILTLAPLYALEGGCDIYREFSAGVFAYRIAGLMSDSDREAVKVAGAGQLDDLVENSPPSAVILGVEPEFLEEPIFRSAVKGHWRQKVYEGGIIAYFE